MALVGLVTFFVELRTRSVKRGIALVSIPLSLVSVALSRSPVIAVVALLVVVAMAALYGLRRMSAPRRWWGQLVLAVLLVASGILALVFRARLIVLLSAGNVADVRVALWQEMWSFIKLQPLQGWGFIGFWRTQFTPYLFLDDVTGTGHGSGLNAFLDVTLQTGFIGLVLFARARAARLRAGLAARLEQAQHDLRLGTARARLPHHSQRGRELDPGRGRMDALRHLRRSRPHRA